MKGSETGCPDTSDQRPRGPKGPVTPSPASRTCLQLRTALVTFRQPLSLRFVQVLDVLLGSFSPLQYLLREMRRVHFIPGSTRDHPPGTSLRTSERRWPCRRIPVPLRHQVTVSHAVCCPERGTGERSFFSFFSGRPTRRVDSNSTVSPCHRVTPMSAIPNARLQGKFALVTASTQARLAPSRTLPDEHTHAHPRPAPLQHAGYRPCHGVSSPPRRRDGPH